jgi:hypothetical protein
MQKVDKIRFKISPEVIWPVRESRAESVVEIQQDHLVWK